VVTDLSTAAYIASLRSFIARQSINPIWATIFTDSRITLDSLQNHKNHGFLVEEIRKKFASLEGSGWQIRFSRVKVHTGVHGNELADKEAKEAAQRAATHYEYTRIPKSYLCHRAAEKAQTKMASRMDSKQQGCCNKTIFSIRAEQTRNKINTNHKASSRAGRTRENKGISPPVPPKGRCEMYIRPQRSNHGSSPIPL